MANHILKTDTLNKGRVKINAAIDHASKAIDNSEQASNASNQAVQIAQSAESKSEYTQQQLDNIIIESGTSDAETIQARGKHSLLYERLDASDTNIQRSILDFRLKSTRC
ncbi:hypothetical protein ACA29_17075 [Lederbergia galactosidilytica]|uniref:Uncharacterized protein n=1 Tax=Lederbergia galactosidilytica TaxID=217031 RepID=A0A0Q9Y3V9_9BACI|nr:hypothetical protein ACA29_17075 [Lederbergia galactosidilytica]